MSRALGPGTPVAGGIDLDLPGDGVRLAATRWPGRGTPVVLLHGLASQRRFWNLVVPHLGGLPIVAIDQRGHGDSDRPADGYDPPSVAADLAAAMDALGWSRAVLVGHSWGAAVAASYGADHPDRTLAVVCIDGGFNEPLLDAESRAQARERLRPPRIAAPPEQIEQMLRSHAPAGWSEEVAAAVLPIFAVDDDGLARSRLTIDTHMQILDDLLVHDSPAALRRLRCPVWLVSCESPDAPAIWVEAKARVLQQLAAELPTARTMRWGGAVHDVPLQWPALVAGLVRAAVDDAAVTGRAET